MQTPHPIKGRGFFWLPNNPEQQYPGDLTISTSGEISLEILHHPEDTASQALHDKTPFGLAPGRICGILDSRSITLEECIAYDDPFHFLRFLERSVSVHRLDARTAYIGTPFASGEKISFSKIELSLESLNEWFDITGFDAKTEFVNQKARWTLQYDQPEDTIISLPNGTQMKFVISPSFIYPHNSDSKLSSEITQRVHISLAAKEMLPVEEFFLMIQKIQTFLCLVTNRITRIEWLSGYSKKELDKWDQEIETKIYFHRQVGSPTWNRPSRMMCTYSTVSEDFERMFLNWFDRYEVVQPAFDLYLSSRTGAHKNLSGVFLSLVQALETFHRRTIGGAEMEPSDYEALCTIVVESVPDDKREFMKSKLKYANEVSLRRRLKDLFDQAEHVLGPSSQVKPLINNIVNARNYLTHYDKGSERAATEIISRDLHGICLELDILVQACFLHFAGMKVDRIKTMVPLAASKLPRF